MYYYFGLIAWGLVALTNCQSCRKFNCAGYTNETNLEIEEGDLNVSHCLQES